MSTESGLRNTYNTAWKLNVWENGLYFVRGEVVLIGIGGGR